MPKRILITGANGFVGRFLGHYLHNNGYQIVHGLRNRHSDSTHLAPGDKVYSGVIDEQTNWSNALVDVDCVIHLAARVHVMQETDSNPLAAFQQTNFHGSLNLARQAINAGVKRFIYLSTIKVNGESTNDKAFFADDPPVSLQEPYAIAKQQAENELLALSQQKLIEVAIIRPPLVYGPAVKGNYLRLMKLVEKKLPLPFAKINNQRSLVSVHNLSSLIQTCIEHPKAAGEIFLVSDGKALSTSQLLEALAKGLNCQNRLFYFPHVFLRILTTIIGKSKEYERLFGSLKVDIEKNRELLDWQPNIDMHDAMLETIRYYQQHQKK